jgi:hypothetical protein
MIPDFSKEKIATALVPILTWSVAPMAMVGPDRADR